MTVFTDLIGVRLTECKVRCIFPPHGKGFHIFKQVENPEFKKCSLLSVEELNFEHVNRQKTKK